MEKKPQLSRRTVKTVSRLSARERRCSQNGKITAPVDGAIRLAAEPPPKAAPPAAPTRGRVEVVETYFDADGRPIKRKSLGAARIARSYDERGNQVEEAYFNTEGKPTVRKGLGAARISWSYDESGKRIEAALYDAEGAPLPRRGRPRKREFEGV